MDALQNIIDGLDPKEAANALADATRRILPLLDDEGRSETIMRMLGEPGGDKVTGLVHL
jgi:hypothetical protein